MCFIYSDGHRIERFGDNLTKTLEENRWRLFSLDAKLRAEANQILKQSGIGIIIREEGFKPVGSYVMRTMTWRDLDFERTDDQPDWQQHWALGAKFARTQWIWGFRCLDTYRDPRNPEGEGLYWRLEVTNPAVGNIWIIDLWTARPEEYEPYLPKRNLWTSRLTEDSRYHILVIKEAVCNLPEYHKSLLSTHIYEAVLEHGVRSIDEFWDWWKKNYGK
jgi:hypothetical protein